MTYRCHSTRPSYHSLHLQIYSNYFKVFFFAINYVMPSKISCLFQSCLWTALVFHKMFILLSTETVCACQFFFFAFLICCFCFLSAVLFFFCRLSAELKRKVQIDEKNKKNTNPTTNTQTKDNEMLINSATKTILNKKHVYKYLHTLVWLLLFVQRRTFCPHFTSPPFFLLVCPFAVVGYTPSIAISVVALLLFCFLFTTLWCVVARRKGEGATVF